MNREVKTSANGGLSLLNMLGVLFIAFKLADIIDWSWWWVLAPIWIPYAILGLMFALLGISMLVARSRKPKRKMGGRVPPPTKRYTRHGQV